MNSSATSPSADPAAPGREAEEAGGTFEVLMPKMGISVSEGTIVEWRKQPGDWIEADETIADVTTDKIDVEIPSPAGGIVARLVVEAGESVEVGAVIAEIDHGRQRPGRLPRARPADRRPPPARRGGGRPVGLLLAGRAADRRQARDRPRAGRGKRDRRAGPKARRPGARADRERERHSREAPTGPAHGVPVPPRARRPSRTSSRPSGASRCRSCARRSRGTWSQVARRRPIARRSSRSTCRGSARRRAELKPAMARKGVGAHLPRVRRAWRRSRRSSDHPVLNASVDGDELVYHDDVNLGIAVALDEGLIVPVIRARPAAQPRGHRGGDRRRRRAGADEAARAR